MPGHPRASSSGGEALPGRAVAEEWPALDQYLAPGGTSWAGPVPV